MRSKMWSFHLSIPPFHSTILFHCFIPLNKVTSENLNFPLDCAPDTNSLKYIYYSLQEFYSLRPINDFSLSLTISGVDLGFLERWGCNYYISACKACTKVLPTPTSHSKRPQAWIALCLHKYSVDCTIANVESGLEQTTTTTITSSTLSTIKGL